VVRDGELFFSSGATAQSGVVAVPIEQVLDGEVAEQGLADRC
jgi:hypothetical protein